MTDKSPSEQESKLKLPTGEAKKLSDLTRREWGENSLLFSTVQNKVLVVNPFMHIPLKLEEGKPSPLGLFAEAAFKEKPGELAERGHVLEVWPDVHKRSAILGRLLFADDEGRIYRDIDLKGIGLVDHIDHRFVALGKRLTGDSLDKRRYGLLDRDSAYAEYQTSEEFLNAGIRTWRIIAVVELEEIIVNGFKVSLKEAIGRGILDENFHPVIAVRAFGTKARIEDIYPTRRTSEEFRNLLLDDARRIVSQELGYEQALTNEEYLQWFAQTLGRNLALAHKSGWYINFPTIQNTRQNITLDCRFGDLEELETLKTEKERAKDFLFINGALGDLTAFLGNSTGWKDWEEHPLNRQFRESYGAVFSPKEREHYFRRG